MTAVAIPLPIPLPDPRPHAAAAGSRLRTAALTALAAWVDVPRTLPPPHDPVEAEPESYLVSATRRRAGSTFD
ncbi:hypothetical protein KL86APRO_12609 [uncultured Alphaproteobacteria bacterium]|uniref:Uncharacterized protein n=1 Tax=uncultured Alphaproteobacteria bacterium TaxID=91750 RepID=A0A212KCK8_9PROT|nr:hypothetical protein KL86APRO_12609 [uncultured Alphaproteobacteria bacterium]